MEISPQNLHPHILDIPPEVLVEIFGFLAVVEPLGHSADIAVTDSSSWSTSSFRSTGDADADPDDSADTTEWETPAILGWIKVTHVCSQWRHVALDYSILWGALTVDPELGRTWIEEALRRSKETPLDLEILWAGRHALETVKPIFLHNMNRIRTLVLEEVSLAVSGLLDRPAPILEELFVAFPSSTRHHLPAELFDNHAPRLRRLTIWDASAFPWATTIIEGLVHFELETTFHGHASFPPLSVFFNALSRMKQLETLILIRHLPNHKSDHVGIPAIIPLPQLKKLHMDGDVYDCSNVLRHLSIPPNTNVALTYRFPAGPLSLDYIHDVKEALALEQAFSTAEKQHQIQTLAVVYSTYEFTVSNHHIDYYMRLFGWRSPLFRQATDGTTPPPHFGDDDLGAVPTAADIKVIFDLARQSVPLLPAQTCRALDLRFLRVLSVDLSHLRWDIDTHLDIFRDAHLVEHLRLVGGSISTSDQAPVLDFLEALRTRVAPAASPSSENPDFRLFPRLASLSLLDVDPAFAIGAPKSVQDQLRELLLERKREGAPISVVYIKTRRRRYEGWSSAVNGLDAEVIFENAFVDLDLSSDSGLEDRSYRETDDEGEGEGDEEDSESESDAAEDEETEGTDD